MKGLMNENTGPVAPSVAKSMNSFSVSVPTRHDSPANGEKINVLFLNATAKRYPTPFNSKLSLASKEFVPNLSHPFFFIFIVYKLNAYKFRFQKMKMKILNP